MKNSVEKCQNVTESINNDEAALMQVELVIVDTK